MPLMHGKSEKAFSQNVRTEMEHGKPQKQALAIAYAMKKRSKKMAKGGYSDDDDDDDGEKYESRQTLHEKGVNRDFHYNSKGRSEAGTYARDAKDPVFSPSSQGKFLERSKKKHRDTLSEMKSMKKPNLYAKGGYTDEEGIHVSGYEGSKNKKLLGQSEAGDDYRGAENYRDVDNVKAKHHQVLGQMNKMRKHNREYLAEGGMCGVHGAKNCGVCMAEGGDVDDDDDLDMVGRIMKKRTGEPVADFEQNDFDYMDQEKAGHEADYTGENEGDELGDEQEDDDRKDIVARIMRSRAKKDRMPRPA